MDLCDAEGRTFLNLCWSLEGADTLAREKAAFSFGAQELPQAAGLVLFHEHSPAAVRGVPNAMPAWRWMLAGS